MTLIAYGSDIHLEMNDVDIKNTEKADVLILAGDVFVEADLKEFNSDIDSFLDDYRSYRIHNFFINCSKEFKDIIFVTGNHENYRSDFDKTIPNIKKKLSYIKNLHILEKDFIIIDGVQFIGSTLWTDMNNNCESSKEFIKRYMNDFRIIKKLNRKFTPDDAIEEHNKTLEYFNKEITSGKVVVVTHHAPSSLSIADEYKGDELMNGGYYSDLTKFIEDRTNIKVWIHGHTHTKFDYTIGNTRILCNPRGYRGEKSFSEFKLDYVTI